MSIANPNVDPELDYQYRMACRRAEEFPTQEALQDRIDAYEAGIEDIRHELNELFDGLEEKERTVERLRRAHVDAEKEHRSSSDDLLARKRRIDAVKRHMRELERSRRESERLMHELVGGLKPGYQPHKRPAPVSHLPKEEQERAMIAALNDVLK